MKWILWTICAVLAALWTGTLALMAAMVDWTAGAMRQAGSSATSMLSLPPELPGWLSMWIEPGTWTVVVQAIQQRLQALQPGLPTLGTGWLEPLVWALWGIGMFVLVVVAAGSHWWVARRSAAAGVHAGGIDDMSQGAVLPEAADRVPRA